MRIYILLPLVLLFSCRSVKVTNSNAQNVATLLKDAKELSSDAYQGRKTGTKGAEMARSYIKKRFKSIGLTSFQKLPNYEQAFTLVDTQGKTLNGKNVVGYIPGKTDDVIVISGHYDHLGIINNEIYNGADDNASGIAGLLKIAGHYAKAKPNHTLVFVAFDAGEQGWKGSAYFVDHSPVSLGKIKLNINLDMIGHNERGELFAVGTYKYPQLKNYIVHSVPNLKIMFGHDNPKQKVDDWTYQSDQGAFDRKGIPFLYFGVEDHKDYHRASDKFSTITQEFFINAANGILEIVDHIDEQKDMQAIFRKKLQMNKQ